MHFLGSAVGASLRWTRPAGANPFRNRRRFLDPLDPTHVVAANEYAAVAVLGQEASQQAE